MPVVVCVFVVGLVSRDRGRAIMVRGRLSFRRRSRIINRIRNNLIIGLLLLFN